MPWICLYGLTGLLIPASLATALTISEGGYIREHGSHIDLNWVQLLLSPFAWSVVFLAIISVLYISSGFLTFYASKAQDKPAYDLTRQWHIFWGPPMIIISLFVFLSLRIQNADHFNNAVFNYWWMFALSFVFSNCRCFNDIQEKPWLSVYYGYLTNVLCILWIWNE